MMTTSFQFHGDLPSLLRGSFKGKNKVVTIVDRRASIKDVLESFGLPHTEIGSIHVLGKEIDFSRIVEEGSEYIVEPLPLTWDVSVPSVLRPEPLHTVSFLADVNVGRLGRYLRAIGLDTLYDYRWTDEYISELLRKEQRILLTRDLRLLMRKHVVYGRYIRAIQPVEQLREVVGLFGLNNKLTLFSRCLDCNALLKPVAKNKIIHRLEPLTKKYYSTFSLCPDCDKIYWPGSHIEKMRKLFEKTDSGA